MNSISGLGKEAVLDYGDGDFDVIEPGQFVVCAISGEHILLEDLRYWSVDRQEPYRDAAAAFSAYGKAKQSGGAF
ncbi:MAG: DUF2093 domain-containing protein [Pseudomonadota bacterium]